MWSSFQWLSFSKLHIIGPTILWIYLYIFAQLHLHVPLGHQPQIPVTATIQNATSTKILIPSNLQQKLRNLEGRYCPTGLVTDITRKPKPIVAFSNGAMGDVILIPWIKTHQVEQKWKKSASLGKKPRHLDAGFNIHDMYSSSRVNIRLCTYLWIIMYAYIIYICISACTYLSEVWGQVFGIFLIDVQTVIKVTIFSHGHFLDCCLPQRFEADHTRLLVLRHGSGGVLVVPN